MTSSYFGESYEKDSFWVSLFEAWNNRRTLARLKRERPPGKRLLEIGVGSGSFLSAAREAGYDVAGSDISEPICSRVEQRFGIPVHCGSIETLEKPEAFDVVVMNHVLEHVNNPVSFLTEAERLIVPGGVVHIAVPNTKCWEARLPGWSGYEPYHLGYFEMSTLTRAVHSAGLSISYMETRESFSGWLLAILRTSLGFSCEQQEVKASCSTTTSGKRWPNRIRKSALEHPYRAAMVAFGVMTLPLRAMQAKVGAGDELICLGRKSEARAG